jgi:hypothetical protein
MHDEQRFLAGWFVPSHLRHTQSPPSSLAGSSRLVAAAARPAGVDGAFHRTPTPLDDDSSALAFVFFALWMTPARPSPLRFWWGLIMVVDMGCGVRYELVVGFSNKSTIRYLRLLFPCQIQS